MRTLSFSDPADLPVAAAATRLIRAAHGVLAIPTETFYGLAVDPTDPIAVTRVFECKGRSAEKALPVLCGSLEQVEELVVLPVHWRAALAAAWPAPLTVVLPLKRALPVGDDTLAVRIPGHALLRALLVEVGPLTGTSANRSGARPLADPDDVRVDFGGRLDLLLDGGRTPGGLASTLVYLVSDPPRVLRPGAWVPPESWGVNAP